MKKRILVFGKHPEIMETVLRLLRNSGLYEAEGDYSVSGILRELDQNPFDLLLLGGGVHKTEEVEIRKHLEFNGIHLPVVQHFGGGSGLLFAEIRTALP